MVVFGPTGGSDPEWNFDDKLVLITTVLDHRVPYPQNSADYMTQAQKHVKVFVNGQEWGEWYQAPWDASPTGGTAPIVKADNAWLSHNWTYSSTLKWKSTQQELHLEAGGRIGYAHNGQYNVPTDVNITLSRTGHNTSPALNKDFFLGVGHFVSYYTQQELTDPVNQLKPEMDELKTMWKL